MSENNIIRQTLRGHEVVEGSYNNQPMLTLCNEQTYFKAKHTMGVPKCKEVLDTLPAIIEFVKKHDPSYVLPTLS